MENPPDALRAADPPLAFETADNPPDQKRGSKHRKSPKEIRFRATCDPCATSKVRCDKQQPRCERCVSNNLPCVYSPSRRNGRPPRGTESRKRRMNSNNSSNHTHSHSNSISEVSPLENLLQPDVSMFAANADLGPYTAPPPAPAHTSTLPPSRSSYFSDPLDLDATDPSTLHLTVLDGHHESAVSVENSLSIRPEASLSISEATVSSADPKISPDDMDYYGDAASLASGPPFSLELKEMLNSNPWGSHDSLLAADLLSSNNSVKHGTSLPSSTPTPSERYGKSCDCYVTACETLRNLCFLQTPSYSSSSSISPLSTHRHIPYQAPSPSAASQHSAKTPNPPLDIALTTNRAAIQEVLRLLQCCCALDQYMTVLFASIISKVIKWYKVMISLNAEPPASPFEARLPSEVPQWGGRAHSSSASSSSTHISAIGLTNIGSFSIDHDDQALMTRVVLIRELERVGAAIDALCETQIANQNSRENLPKLALGAECDLGQTLGRWLRAELKRTIDETKATSDFLASAQ